MPTTKTSGDKEFYWCAQCRGGAGRWTTSHSTSTHRKKVSITANLASAKLQDEDSGLVYTPSAFGFMASCKEDKLAWIGPPNDVVLMNPVQHVDCSDGKNDISYSTGFNCAHTDDDILSENTKFYLSGWFCQLQSVSVGHTPTKPTFHVFNRQKDTPLMIQSFPVALMIFSGFMLSMWFTAMLLGCSFWDSVGAVTDYHYCKFPKFLLIQFDVKETPPNPDHLFLTNVAPKIGQHEDNTVMSHDLYP